MINFEDFTEARYRLLIQIAKNNWKIIQVKDYKNTKKACFWRHDIDLSIHRAYRLAQLEANEDFQSTYFVNLHSDFYNPLEEDNVRLLEKIKDLGHELALHFDPSFYHKRFTSNKDLIYWLNFEKEILETTFEVEIKAFSWHNPDVGDWLSLEQDEIAGMINTYGGYFRQNYGYCSDSNGYWRYRRLQDVLESAEDERLQVLTHPGWWTPEPMSPRERIDRCINGRAAKQHQRYDELLEKYGRQNIR